MAFHLSRQTRLFVTFNGRRYEIPILDGYSFNQAMETTEIALSEATSGAGVTRRGRKILNNNLGPAEFSFSSYMKPFTSAGGTLGAAGKATGTDGHHCAVEDVLWALFAGKATTDSNNGITDGTGSIVTRSGSNCVVNFARSNFSTVGECTLEFAVSDGTQTGGHNYKITKAVINEATIDFDLEGLATITWSGFGSELTHETTRVVRASSAMVFEGVDATNNYIENKLMGVTLTSINDSSGTTGVNFQSAGHFPGAGSGVYNIVATGGSITFSNNITYLVPQELGKITKPELHVTGTRTIQGNLTCYLDNQTGGSVDLLEDLLEYKTKMENAFSLSLDLGGGAAPSCDIDMTRVMLATPAISVEDLLSVDITFDALPASIVSGSATGQSEATLTYVGKDVA